VATNSAFNVTPKTAVIRGGDSALFRLKTTPIKSGNDDGYLILQTNEDPGTESIYVSFIGVGPAAGGDAIPDRYNISQNYPNPFNPSTTIEYGIPVNSAVRIDVFNVLGARVSTIQNGVRESGTWSVSWNGLSDEGGSLPSGVYFVRIVAQSLESDGQGFIDKIKMFLVK
jgi:hypothetical protein